MQPELAIDPAVVAGNARAWRRFAGAALYAVVKADAYGWGLGRIVPALEDAADAYCVADAQELEQLRRFSSKRALILGPVEPDRLAETLRDNALPTIHTSVELEIAGSVFASMGRAVRVRIGVRPAAAWSGLTLEELRTLAPGLAACGAEVEVWSHITDWDRRAEQLQTFRHALHFLEDAGVNVVSCDVASTFTLAADGANGSAVRVGIGLFGATGGPAVPGIRCALRVAAPIVRLERHSPGTRLGYGGTMLRVEERIATARCGYADGLPKGLAGTDDILSVGMQYVTARADRAGEARSVRAAGSQLVLLDASSNLDEFAARSGVLPHEVVTAFGNRARAGGVSIEV